jgi:hypothetical protein
MKGTRFIIALAFLLAAQTAANADGRQGPLPLYSQPARNAPGGRPNIDSCLPSTLHSFSRLILDRYLEGRLTTAQFRRWFHMPNSEYLMPGDCIAQIVDPSHNRAGSGG